jgi:osmotically-inducible protein OsmY
VSPGHDRLVHSAAAAVLAAALLGAVKPAAARSFVDWETIAETRMALSADPAVTGTKVGDIEIDAAGPVVVLRGEVATDEARRAAEAAAARVHGVRSVDNALRVNPATTPPVAPLRDSELRDLVRRTLRTEARLRRAPIRIEVADAVVHLSGHVADTWARALASALARQVPGVRAVDNRLWARSLDGAAGSPRRR